MEFKTFVFYMLATIMVLASLRVITARNPVHAALALVLAFFNAAGIWLLLHAEFLAIALIMVYVGAVMVLFLFVVMMLDINVDRLREGFWRHFPLAAIVGAAIALQLWLVLSHGSWQGKREAGPGIAGVDNVRALGSLMFTEYVYPVQVAGLILLVGMVAAVVLTLRRRKDSKYQRPGDQVRVRRSDRVRLVAMPTDAEGRQDARR